MAYLYAMSDPHGCLDVFERALSTIDLESPGNRLYLLGDYVPHQRAFEPEADFLARCEESLEFTRAYCARHRDRVVALMGNNDFYLLETVLDGRRPLRRKLVAWLRGLPLYAETDDQIFVHAGIDEETDDLWEWGTDPALLVSKFPPTFGRFRKDIIAGHVGVREIVGDPAFRGVIWDGRSHYYIDGTTEGTGVMPILRYDTEKHAYANLTATTSGVEPASPVLSLWDLELAHLAGGG